MPRRAEPTPEKRCGICTKRLSRKRFNGRLEDRTTYLRRQFCSLSCANSRTKGGRSRRAFQAQARKQMKPTCEACGDTRYRHVHHVNANWSDNRPRNLQTLCLFCHQFWHAAHMRRGVKVRSRMPRLSDLWR